MNISEFVEQQKTTLDTVKYYIKLKLLTPQKKNNWYIFSSKEKDDFQNIMYLKSLGLSLELIKEIKESHEKNCGTSDQWENNLSIIESELERTKEEKEKIILKETLLLNVKEELNKKIESAKNFSYLTY